MEQFQIIQEDVLSHTNLLELARQFGLYSPTQLAMQSDVADDMKDRILIEPVTIDGGGRGASTILEVSFDAGAPRLAADVANRLVQLILDKDTELRTARATDAVQFFTQESARLDAALKELDAQILKFKSQNIDALPDSLTFRRDRQSAQQQRLVLLTQEQSSLRQRIQDLKSRPLAARAVPVTPEEKALDDLRTALATQLETFSEASPTIVAIRARIAALESQIVKAAGLGDASEPQAAGLAGDPELADLTYRLKAVGDEIASIQATTQDLDQSIRATPANETALNVLDRNHQNLQAQYDASVTRLAEASTSQQIELRLKGERLSLIASALPPQSQLSPKRLQIVLAAFAAAMVLGAAVVAVPEFLNKRIRRPVELVKKLDIRPMVTVPYITPPPLSVLRRQSRQASETSQAALRKVFRKRPRRAAVAHANNVQSES